MSGVGKSTLAEHAKNRLVEKGYAVMILDGDAIREKYKTKLGFGREDVKKNNFYIARLCQEHRNNYDVIMVAIIIYPLFLEKCIGCFPLRKKKAPNPTKPVKNTAKAKLSTQPSPPSLASFSAIKRDTVLCVTLSPSLIITSPRLMCIVAGSSDVTAISVAI